MQRMTPVLCAISLLASCAYSCDNPFNKLPPSVADKALSDMMGQSRTYLTPKEANTLIHSNALNQAENIALHNSAHVYKTTLTEVTGEAEGYTPKEEQDEGYQYRPTPPHASLGRRKIAEYAAQYTLQNEYDKLRKLRTEAWLVLRRHGNT